MKFSMRLHEILNNTLRDSKTLQIINFEAMFWDSKTVRVSKSTPVAKYMKFVHEASGVVTGGGGYGGRVPPLTAKKFPKIGKNREKIRKNREKRGKIGKKRLKSGRFFHFAPPDR